MAKTNLVNMSEVKETQNNAVLYDLIMNSVKKVGAKTYAYIPVELLFVDDLFQRKSSASKKKIKKLAEKWNINKMDALKTVPHPEENVFSVVDGYHRLSAAIINGEKGLECEIVLGLSDDPRERIIQEATLFATQNDEVDILSPVEKHKANVLRGVRENIIVDKLIKKYNISLKTNPSHGRVNTGHLGGYTEVLRLAKGYGEQLVDDVFYIICESRWNIASNGLSANVISPIANMLKFHPEHRTEIIEYLVKYFKPIEPLNFFSSAMDKYPERKEKERLAIFLEDYLCDNIEMERTYVSKAHIKVTASKIA